MSLPTRHASADDSAGLLLWQVTNRWQAQQRAALKPFGLTHVQFVLLASLSWLDASVSQREVAEHAATDAMMTSQVLRALEQRGLVTREPHPDDGRAWAVRATPDGATLAARANHAVEDVDERFFGRLGAQAPLFTGLLRALR